jgi:hypothetical protein
VVRSLGQWSLRHVETKVSTGDLDADVLMWNLRRNLDPANFVPEGPLFSSPFLAKGRRRNSFG